MFIVFNRIAQIQLSQRYNISKYLQSSKSVGNNRLISELNKIKISTVKYFDNSSSQFMATPPLATCVQDVNMGILKYTQLHNYTANNTHII